MITLGFAAMCGFAICLYIIGRVRGRVEGWIACQKWMEDAESGVTDAREQIWREEDQWRRLP